MLIFGLLFMLLVIGLPALLIAAVIAGVWGLSSRRNGPLPSTPTYSSPTALTTPMMRHCSHCGQGLQDDWTHCPKCGAPA